MSKYISQPKQKLKTEFKNAAAKANPVDLIETLATRLLELVMNFGGGEATGIVKKAKITVHKPKAPIEHEFSDVSVTVKAKRK